MLLAPEISRKIRYILEGLKWRQHRVKSLHYRVVLGALSRTALSLTRHRQLSSYQSGARVILKPFFFLFLPVFLR